MYIYISTYPQDYIYYNIDTDLHIFKITHCPVGARTRTPAEKNSSKGPLNM